MSTVRYFRHDDVGAPTLTGEVGSLTNLLRKCLVGTAGVAYGSKSSAGWTEKFAGAASNIAVFQNNDAEGGSACCVRINDNAPGAAGALEAQVIVYAAMTDVDTGTLGTVATWLRKSATANTTARKWLVVADGRTAWVYVYENGDGDPALFYDTSLHGFGDIASLGADGSNNRYFVLGRNTANATGSGSDLRCFMGRPDLRDTPALQVADIAGLAAPANHGFMLAPGDAFGGSNAFMPTSVLGEYVFAGAPLLQKPGGGIRGALRGLSLALTRVAGLTDGSNVPGSTTHVLVCGSAYSGQGAAYSFGACIDTVGPW